MTLKERATDIAKLATQRRGEWASGMDFDGPVFKLALKHLAEVDFAAREEVSKSSQGLVEPDAVSR